MTPGTMTHRDMSRRAHRLFVASSFKFCRSSLVVHVWWFMAGGSLLVLHAGPSWWATHPFVAPDVNPRMNSFCAIRNTRIDGASTITANAYSAPVVSSMYDRK